MKNDVRFDAVEYTPFPEHSVRKKYGRGGALHHLPCMLNSSPKMQPMDHRSTADV